MKVKDIPYYARFIFSGDNGACYSTTDKEILNFIIDRSTGEPIFNIKRGQKISFISSDGTNDELIYTVEEITVRHLVDDLELLKYGIDLEDCTQSQGDEKEMLFSILVEMKLN